MAWASAASPAAPGGARRRPRLLGQLGAVRKAAVEHQVLGERRQRLGPDCRCFGRTDLDGAFECLLRADGVAAAAPVLAQQLQELGRGGAGLSPLRDLCARCRFRS